MKRASLAALLTVILLALSPILPAASTPPTDSEDPDLVDWLKKLREKGFPISDEEIELAEKVAKGKPKPRKPDKPDRDPWDALPKLDDEELSSTYYVTLGSDTAIAQAELGREGIWTSWGWPYGVWGADAVVEKNKDTAAVLLYPCVGGIWPYADVGVSLYILGSGSQKATIRVNGHAYGYVWYGGWADADAKAAVVVWDHTTRKAVGSKIIFDAFPAGYKVEGWAINSDFSASLTVELKAGHVYIIWLRLLTEAEVAFTGGAVSDFGPQDNDYAGEGVWFKSIAIDF